MDDDIQEMFEVETILDHRRLDDEIEYFVKWAEYGADENSWEPDSCFAYAPEALKDYWKKNEKEAAFWRKDEELRAKIRQRMLTTPPMPNAKLKAFIDKVNSCKYNGCFELDPEILAKNKKLDEQCRKALSDIMDMPKAFQKEPEQQPVTEETRRRTSDGELALTLPLAYLDIDKSDEDPVADKEAKESNAEKQPASEPVGEADAEDSDELVAGEDDDEAEDFDEGVTGDDDEAEDSDEGVAEEDDNDVIPDVRTKRGPQDEECCKAVSGGNTPLKTVEKEPGKQPTSSKDSDEVVTGEDNVIPDVKRKRGRSPKKHSVVDEAPTTCTKAKKTNAEERKAAAEELFEVEKVIDVRVARGKKEFFVSWVGFGPEENSWEPESGLASAPEALEQFWARRDKEEEAEMRKKLKAVALDHADRLRRRRNQK